MDDEDYMVLSVYGDCDAGYGRTYAQIVEDEEEAAHCTVDRDLVWSDFNFGDPAKRSKKRRNK
jgi:hypothetical protein